MTDVSHALEIMDEEMLAAEPEAKEVQDRPVHKLEGIMTMHQRTLETALMHRKGMEEDRNKNLAAIEAIFREDIDRCDKKITTLTESLTLLQTEKVQLQQSLERRRQEIIQQFKDDEAALMKIIKAQRMVITALGDSDEGSRPNGSRKPDRGNDKKPETGQGEQRTN
jgi:hypothetical protein